jgi:hypothetical protein
LSFDFLICGLLSVRFVFFHQYPNVVPIQAIMNGAPPPAPQPPPGTSTAAIAQQQQAGVTATPMAIFAPQATDQALAAGAAVGTVEGSAPAPAP